MRKAEQTTLCAVASAQPIEGEKAKTRIPKEGQTISLEEAAGLLGLSLGRVHKLAAECDKEVL